MNYVKVIFNLNPNITEAAEIFISQLGESGYESFVMSGTGFEAYIPEKDFQPEKLNGLFSPFPEVRVNINHEVIPDKNWNKVWEKNYFKPIIIGKEVMIRSSVHKKNEGVKYDIIIDPEMAFGTGHHETTGLMIKFLPELDVKNKTVLDMGCGTGILGILCSKMGAKEITGIDIEEWAYNNARKNCRNNHVSNMKVLQGDAGLIGDNKYDVILANINRNILLNDLSGYSKALNQNGILLLSGFYESDLEAINTEARKHDLKNISVKKDNNWVASTYRKGND